MIVGTTFALAMVLLVLLVPKPSSSSRLQSWLATLTSPERETSKFAPGKDGQKDKPGAKKQRIDNNAKKQGKQPGENGGGDSKDGPESDESGEGSSDKKGEQGSSENRQQQQGEKSENQNSNNADDQNQGSDDRGQQERQDQNPNQKQAEERNNKPQAEQNPDRNNAQKREDRQDNQNDSNSKSNNSKFQQTLQSITKFLNWVIYIVGFIALAFVCWIFREEIAKFLNSLFGKKKKPVEHEITNPEPAFEAPAPSYRSFSDPFRSGKVNSMRAKQVLDYSMEALKAWAREFDVETAPDVTPEELAHQITVINETVSHFAKELASLYGRCAFSRDTVSREELNPLIELWRQMDLSFAQKQRQSESELASHI